MTQTGRARSLIAPFLSPILGLAILAALNEEAAEFVKWAVAVVALASPLMGWAVVRLLAQARANRKLATRDLMVYGSSLAVIVAGVWLRYLLEAALSHGAVPAWLFRARCLLAGSLVAACPLAELLLFRARQSGKGAAYSAVVTRVAVLLLVVAPLVTTVGPPLNAAMRLGHRGAAKALIELGADVNKSDAYHATPLYYALARTDLELTRRLLDRGARMDTPGLGLVRAVETGNHEMLNFLLDHGADPNALYMGATPLVWACGGRDRKIVQTLLQRGANVNSRASYRGMSYDGKTALDIASERGDAALAELLLRHDGR